jgi:trans-aconitate methyltransferase
MTHTTSSSIVESSWVFDHSVAQRFQQEATTHIPDYQRVINLCLSCTQQVFGNRKDIRIIDVGSALGATMHEFISRGYTQTFGIDNSKDMICSSQYPDRVTLCDQFVTDGLWDVVLANWTLHFVQQRKEYLEQILHNMNAGGLLIITDKMHHTDAIENLYYDFKRANGVSEETIQKKKIALDGVLITRPLSWYLEVLDELGFQDIQVINTCYMFSTLYARKP